MSAAESDPLRRSVDWIYGGVWGILTRWFRVTAEPPELPSVGNVTPMSMRPADGFLNYQRTLFLFGWLGPIIGTLVATAVVGVTVPIVGALLTVPILAVLLLTVAASWIAIHLQFDTQWYVFTDRAVRIRRGVWIVRENTITFENVQDITILQGPLQRHFGISDVVIETAGGSVVSSGKGETSVNTHSGRIQGITNAQSLKELIASRVRQSRSAGLGDEHHDDADPPSSADETAVLREILTELRAMHMAR
jgi:membrane protein YdbS with pleckstrin-like domain